jgi:general stress protein YciG
MQSHTSHRGFAGMDDARKKEIARAGGRAAHKLGTAHEFTVDEASLAGKKGGQVVSRDRSHMALIGRLGGLARGQRLRAARGLSGGGTSSGPVAGRDG